MAGYVTGDAWPEVNDWPDVPTHLEAEGAVLGHILLDNGVYDKVRGKIGPDDFFLDANRTVFLRMTEMREAEMPVDMVTLSNHMAGKKTGDVREIDEVGGVAFLAGLSEGRIPGAVAAYLLPEYVAILKEKTKLRRIIEACTKATAQCMAQGETAQEIVGQLGTALKGIGKRK